MGKLNDRIVIITGVGKGLGRQNAVRFAAEGARLAIADWNQENLDETAELCREEGADVLAVLCDNTKEQDRQSLVQATVEQYGSIDVLINNANRQASVVPFIERDIHDLREAMEVGVFAVFRLMQLCYPHMKRTTGPTASIVNFVSGVYETGMAGYAAYVPDKSAIRGLSMVVAREWGKDGIRVNTIAPVALTDTILEVLPDDYREVVKQQMSTNSLGRVGVPAEDIAPALIFLASDDSRWITGQNLNADGGEVIYAV